MSTISSPSARTLELPAGLKPAIANTLRSSLQQAAEVVAANPGLLLDRADAMAQLVVGLAQPGGELLEDRIQRQKTIKRVLEEGDWLSAEDINKLQPNPPANLSLPASDWKRRGRIYSVSYGGREYFARYQFDAMMQPLPVLRQVLQAFGEVADAWVLAAWFHYPNAWLNGSPPMKALDDATAVVAAAAQRRGTYAA